MRVGLGAEVLPLRDYPSGIRARTLTRRRWARWPRVVDEQAAERQLPRKIEEASRESSDGPGMTWDEADQRPVRLDLIMEYVPGRAEMHRDI